MRRVRPTTPYDDIKQMENPVRQVRLRYGIHQLTTYLPWNRVSLGGLIQIDDPSGYFGRERYWEVEKVSPHVVDYKNLRQF